MATRLEGWCLREALCGTWEREHLSVYLTVGGVLVGPAGDTIPRFVGIMADEFHRRAGEEDPILGMLRAMHVMGYHDPEV